MCMKHICSSASVVQLNLVIYKIGRYMIHDESEDWGQA